MGKRTPCPRLKTVDLLVELVDYVVLSLDDTCLLVQPRLQLDESGAECRL